MCQPFYASSPFFFFFFFFFLPSGGDPSNQHFGGGWGDRQVLLYGIAVTLLRQSKFDQCKSHFISLLIISGFKLLIEYSQKAKGNKFDCPLI